MTEGTMRPEYSPQQMADATWRGYVVCGSSDDSSEYEIYSASAWELGSPADLKADCDGRVYQTGEVLPLAVMHAALQSAV